MRFTRTNFLCYGLAIIMKPSWSWLPNTLIHQSMRFCSNNREELLQQTMPALKTLLREHQLPVSGRKCELVDRFLSRTTIEKFSQERKGLLKTQRSCVFRDPTFRIKVDGNENLRTVSWNVNGLRALLKSPNSFIRLLETERPHVICLQETKLQEIHVDQCAVQLKDLAYVAGLKYSIRWSCSRTRKGYSGVAVLYDIERLHEPEKWRTGVGLSSADEEGRALTLSWNLNSPGSFSLVTVYSPNSGQGLKRLQYRCEEWDPALASYLSGLRGHVLLCGDLNVAHSNKDFYNPKEKRMMLQAGTTPEERNSFSRNFLCPTGLNYSDTFRDIHGVNCQGIYTYWSARARNRPLNRGLRLDYFLSSPSVDVCDAFVLDQLQGSDHCPVGVDIRPPLGVLK